MVLAGFSIGASMYCMERNPCLQYRGHTFHLDPYKRHQILKINILLIIMLIQYLVENQNILTVMNITHV